MMKRFLILIASVWFVWGIGLAQNSTIGTVSVQVPKHLQINIQSTDIQFTYNEYNGWPPTNSTDWSFVKIDANVNWKLAISPLSGQTVLTNPNTTMTIPASQFEYRISEVVGIVTSGSNNFHKFYPTSAVPITGSKNVNFKLYWQPSPNFTGNLFAGDYKIDLNYVLTEE